MAVRLPVESVWISITAGIAVSNTGLTRKAYKFTRLLRTEAWLLLTRKTNSYISEEKRVSSNMRSGFWKGVIAGSLIGAAVSMMAGSKMANQKKGLLGYSTGRAGARARRMFRGVSKSVNNLIK